MAKQKTQKTEEAKKPQAQQVLLGTRGRVFEGYITKKFAKRVVIEFERTVYVKKYERFYKKKTKIHARLPDALAGQINVGDYVRAGECRPLSKLIHFIVIEKIRSAVGGVEK